MKSYHKKIHYSTPDYYYSVLLLSDIHDDVQHRVHASLWMCLYCASVLHASVSRAVTRIRCYIFPVNNIIRLPCQKLKMKLTRARALQHAGRHNQCTCIGWDVSTVVRVCRNTRRFHVCPSQTVSVTRIPIYNYSFIAYQCQPFFFTWSWCVRSVVRRLVHVAVTQASAARVRYTHLLHASLIRARLPCEIEAGLLRCR